MTTVELWLTRPDAAVYDPDTDPEHFEGCIVRIGKRIVGEVEEVLEIRPEAVKIRLLFEGDVVPS